MAASEMKHSFHHSCLLVIEKCCEFETEVDLFQSVFDDSEFSLIYPLRANPTKWSNALKQFVGC